VVCYKALRFIILSFFGLLLLLFRLTVSDDKSRLLPQRSCLKLSAKMSSVLNANEMKIIPAITNAMNQSHGITTQSTTHSIFKPEVTALIATQIVMEIAMCYISTRVIFWMCKKKTSCCFGNSSGKLKVLYNLLCSCRCSETMILTFKVNILQFTSRSI